jgi:hypothetical protein
MVMEASRVVVDAPQRASFNIDRFMETSGRVDLSDIDWAEVPKHPLTPEARRTLRYFMQTEGSTFFYTKALLATRASYTEPELAPFISVWNYEEEFHGRAFRRFIEACGTQVDQSFRTEMFLSRGPGEHVDEIGQKVLSVVFPHAWPAVHMVWGTIQEWTTYTAYQALIDRVNHPILSEICRRIMKQELRHFAFYRDHARRRLAADKHTQTVVSYALKIGWTPVGDGMNARSEVLHALRFLFDGMDGPTIAGIERKVRELPGLEWFDMFTKFVTQHDLRTAPRSWFSEGANLGETRIDVG